MAYDGFFAGLSTRASVNEILNLAIKTKNEAEDIAVRIKASEENAQLSAIEAALQADRAQRIADGLNGSGTGGGADLKSIGIYSGLDYEIVGGATRDESRNINKALKACGEAGGGVVVIRAVVPNDPIYINGPVQIEYNNVTLYFESNVQYGPDAFIRISGSFMEIRRPGQNQLIALSQDATVDEFGALQFNVRDGDQAFLQVGDRLTLRGLNDIVGNAIEKQTITVAKIDGRIVTAIEDPEYDFKAVYPNSDWEPDWTTGTTVSIVNYSAFPQFSVGPNVISATVEDGSKFKPGDLLYVSDARLEKDVMSPEPATLKSSAIMEHVRVQSIVGNLVTFDKPIQRQYLNQWKGGLSQMNPVVNSHIVMKDVTWSAPQSSRKNPAVAINFGDKCTIKIGSMRGKTGRVGTGVRVAYSYDCTVFDSQILDCLRHGSAEGYGIVIYYSTFCRIKGSLSTGGRHNYLFQTCVSCDILDNTSTDDYISGIDLHGAGCINCRVVGNRVTRSNGHTPDSVNGGAIRNGNTSHMIGDHGTLIANNYIEGYNDNIGAAAIDVSPSSQNVIVRDNHMVDCSIGFRHYKVAERAVVIQKANRVVLIGNTFERVTKPLETQGHATSVIEELVMVDNKSINNAGQFLIVGVPKVTLIDNQIIAPVNTPGNYGFEVRDATDLFATGNVAKDANRGFRIANCPGAKIIKNILDYTRDDFPFQDGGGNTGYIQKNNTLADSGGSGGATIQVGTVTTGAPGTDVVIVNSGTTTDAVFDFTIPRGDPGADGGGGGGGANSTALDGLVGVNGGIPMFTGVGAMQRIPSGTVGRNILTAATVPEAKEQIGLANVDNTSDVLKPVSSATQDALNLKAPLASPIFTGTPTTPHPLAADDSRQVPTTGWTKARIAEAVAAIPPSGGNKKLKFALLGDSLSSNNNNRGGHTSRGFLTWAQFLSGHKFWHTTKLNFGVFGENSNQITARVGQVVAAAPDVCLVEMGGNDTTQSSITIEQMKTNVDTVVSALTGAGIYTIFCTIYPVANANAASHYQKLAAFNQYIRQLKYTHDNVEVLDTYPIVMDKTLVDTVQPEYSYDHTHPGANGAYMLGKELAKVLEKLAPAERHPLVFNNKWDLLNVTSNPLGNAVTNGLLEGAGGVVNGPGASGISPPESWTLDMTDAKGMTVVLGEVPATADNFRGITFTLGGSVPASSSDQITNGGHIILSQQVSGDGVSTTWQNATDGGRFWRDKDVEISAVIEYENLRGVQGAGVEVIAQETQRDQYGVGFLCTSREQNSPRDGGTKEALQMPTGTFKGVLLSTGDDMGKPSKGFKVQVRISGIPGMAVSGKVTVRQINFKRCGV